MIETRTKKKLACKNCCLCEYIRKHINIKKINKTQLIHNIITQ